MHTTGEMGGGSVPAFLAKLWRLVEDRNTDSLISWNENGTSFVIKNQSEFAKELLPLYYKHNNMASFVRQLNMYGFHKIVSVESGGLKVEREDMEFAHIYFMRGQPYLLENIKRKLPASRQDDNRQGQQLVARMLTDVKQLKGKQENMDSKLSNMKKENEALWKELASLRQKHAQQQQIVNRMIQFLVSMMQQNHALGIKRHYSRMINSTAHDGVQRPQLTRGYIRAKRESSTSPGPVISEVTDVLDSILPNQAMDPAEDGSREVPTEAVIDANTYASNILITELVGNTGNLVSPAYCNFASLAPDAGSPGNASVASGSPAPPAHSPSPSVPSPREAGVVPDAGETLGNDALNTILEQSRLSPDLLTTTNPGKVMPTSSSTAPNHGSASDDSPINISVSSPQPQQLASGSSDLTVAHRNREYLDTHVGDMEMQLNNLRDYLRDNNDSMDVATLLGVCPQTMMMETQKDEMNKLLNSETPISIIPDDGLSDGSLQNITGTELACSNASLMELVDENSQFFDDDLMGSISMDEGSLLGQGDGFLAGMSSENNSALNTPKIEVNRGPPCFQPSPPKKAKRI